jgi:hypothetical protein
MCVPENQGTPGIDEVEVGAPIRIDDVLARSALNE